MTHPCLDFNGGLVKHDDVIKWKHFPRYWPFVRGIHRSPVNCPHKGQWRGAFMFSLICVWINGWVNNGDAGDLRRYRAHHDVIVMPPLKLGHGWVITTHMTLLCYHLSIPWSESNFGSKRGPDDMSNCGRVSVRRIRLCIVHGNFISYTYALRQFVFLSRRYAWCW